MAVEMVIEFYRERAQRPLSREPTPSPPPTGSPPLRMMSAGPPSSEEPQAAFEVLEPSEVERIRVEELHHQSAVRGAQLMQACALQKAEALYTPDIEGLLAKLEGEGGPLEVVHTVELKEVQPRQDEEGISSHEEARAAA